MYLDLETLEYPVSAEQIVERHPNTSFPVPFVPMARYALVASITPPAYNTDLQAAREGAPVQEGDAWIQSWVITDRSPEDVAARMAARRSRLKSQATENRWLAETGGIALPDGSRVKTGIDDQNRVTSVLANAQRAGIEVVRFKSDGDVWVDLPITALEQIAVAIALHVQECFMAESEHHAAIDALADDELATYDTRAGWPGLARH